MAQTRIVRDSYAAIAPVREPGPLSWDGHDDSSGPQCRATSPYKVGDVVKFMDGGAIKDALIIRVGSTFRERRADWLPIYTVRLRNKDGSWSKLWRRASPGDIERGFGTWDVH